MSYQKMKEAMPCLVMNPAVWQETIRGGQVIEAAEGEGKSSQFAEAKAIQTSLRNCWTRKVTCLYSDSWMVANVLWRWQQKWKKTNWQCRDKPIWAELHLHLGKTLVYRSKTTGKVHQVDVRVPKNHTTEELQNNEQVDKAAKTEIT